ncbi:MAG: cysteine protease [Ignavibacteriales bacterium CG18_big_fil_WC_8_21_14_2_50_31_20]|nr:MAG: cysteine protease [Ignavibacteriales bacterium CG18_big_fil_WC_8_21_14_2_50_31_20]
MKTILTFLLLSNFIIASNVDLNEIKNFVKNGEFTKAAKLVDELMTNENISVEDCLELSFQKEKMDRIRKDFSKTETDILNYVKKYYPNITSNDLKKWENDGSLEFKVIDGNKFYFNRAASNLFRINKEAKLQKEKIDGIIKDNLDEFLESYIPEILSKKDANSTFFAKKRIRLNYELIVNADAVPEGEVIRCWLPFPREKGERQSDANLGSINNENYVVSPDEYAHKTIYSEQTAIKGKPTEFKLSVEFTGANEFHKLTPDLATEYKTDSDDYKKYTSERLPHIQFTERVKMLSQKIVGDETNPIVKAKKIFKWINDNIPWAGAREYSTIDNISDYCLATGHGDCGIKSLTFITLARYNGIPAKWESGLMLHPDNLNLHDWAEAYFEGIGWVPVDQSFGLTNSEDENVHWFFLGGNDSYHMIINNDFEQPLYPAKTFPRSETVDFQRGEVEWNGGNLYFDKWDYFIDVEYLDNL